VRVLSYADEPEECSLARILDQRGENRFYKKRAAQTVSTSSSLLLQWKISPIPLHLAAEIECCRSIFFRYKERRITSSRIEELQKHNHDIFLSLSSLSSTLKILETTGDWLEPVQEMQLLTASSNTKPSRRFKQRNAFFLTHLRSKGKTTRSAVAEC
jgi:hypothetical protein